MTKTGYPCCKNPYPKYVLFICLLFQSTVKPEELTTISEQRPPANNDQCFRILRVVVAHRCYCKFCQLVYKTQFFEISYQLVVFFSFKNSIHALNQTPIQTLGLQKKIQFYFQVFLSCRFSKNYNSLLLDISDGKSS